ncbi:MAG TPA: 6-phosphofructokinase [Pseudobdellovibrionaceae bacterium]|nr:6-phosphofructokinase [Pseudobdellovibrionaceae bacterium]
MNQNRDPLEHLDRFAPLGQPAIVNRIGVLTSGGDAPGMNAAIRAVVRSALQHRMEIVGLRHGYRGLLQQEVQPLDSGSVGNLLQRGGTFLKTARVPEFHQAQVRARAAQSFRELKLDALVCIGGDGTFTGAHLLWLEHRVPVIGIPATIDNDLYGTESTIGFDSAVNTAVQAIDRIRDTADSHERLFIVEVMGRDSGFIALETGLACGAEEIFFSDSAVTVDQAIDHIRRGQKRGKLSSILITAEGRKPGRAYDLADQLQKKAGLEAKVCILGHTQRGGAPSAFDRVLAARMGASAVEALKRGYCDAMMSWTRGRIEAVSLTQVLAHRKKPPEEWVKLAQTLSS